MKGMLALLAFVPGVEFMNDVTTQEKLTIPKSHVVIDPDKCKGCLMCIMICPSGCLYVDKEHFNVKGFNPAAWKYEGEKSRCNACGLCYLTCPDDAITKIYKLKKEATK